jgi:hypothetical protein
VEIGTEAVQFPEKGEHIKWDFRGSVYLILILAVNCLQHLVRVLYRLELFLSIKACLVKYLAEQKVAVSLKLFVNR